MKNCAFVFIKPHANTDKVRALVKDDLGAKGFAVLKEGEITGKMIDEKKYIDQHYYAIASKATLLQPKELNVPADKFKGQFGLEWQEALDKGVVYNALGACDYLGVTADELDTMWGACKKAKKMVKFGGGFYCGLLEVEGKEPIYAFNGFFMSMRTKFTDPSVSIYYYVVEWEEETLSWADFRGKVLGPTDPVEASKDSLRGRIYTDWEKLGLTEVPNVGDNGVHASASPFEALAERCNWLEGVLTEDAYGKALMAAGLSEEKLKEWSVDPQVNLPEGGKGSLFDQLEDMDSTPCMEKAKELGKL